MSATHYEIIGDLDELRWFYDYCMPRLQPHEFYYMSLSARAKKLTPEEKAIYNFQHNEMFGKEIITNDSFADIVRRLRRYECAIGSYTDKNGLPYPQKCLCVYWNINAGSSVKLGKSIQDYISEYTLAMTSCAISKSEKGMLEAIRNMKLLPHRVYTLASEARSKKVWMDIDMDFEEELTDELLGNIKTAFGDHLPKGAYVLIRTGGGIHGLIKCAALKGNPQEIVKELQVLAKCKECIINPNPMVPLTGTRQYSETVRVLNKDDFADVVLPEREEDQLLS